MSNDKMRELIEELWESDKASALTNRAARALEAALTQQPSPQVPDPLPELDPVEAHKRGEIVSQDRRMYNEGWNACRDAMLTAAPSIAEDREEVERLLAENAELKEWCRQYASVAAKYTGNPCNCIADDGKEHRDYCPVSILRSSQPPVDGGE